MNHVDSVAYAVAVMILLAGSSVPVPANAVMCSWTDASDWVDCRSSQATIVQRKLLSQKAVANNFVEGILALKLRVSYSSGSDTWSQFDCAKLDVSVQLGNTTKIYTHVIPYTSGVPDHFGYTVPYLFVPPFRESEVYVKSVACKVPKALAGNEEQERQPLEAERERQSLEEERERLALEERQRRIEEEARLAQARRAREEERERQRLAAQRERKRLAQEQERSDGGDQLGSVASAIRALNALQDHEDSLDEGSSPVAQEQERSDDWDVVSGFFRGLKGGLEEFDRSGSSGRALLRTLTDTLDELDEGSSPDSNENGAGSGACHQLATRIARRLKSQNTSGDGSQCSAYRDHARTLESVRQELANGGCPTSAYDQQISTAKSNARTVCSNW